MSRIGIILGSTRPRRISPAIGSWVKDVLTDASAGANTYEIIDLAEQNLVHFNEPVSPKAAEEYQEATTRAWAATVQQYDGFIFILPEYNGSYPGVLKDAIDNLHKEWADKPATYVAYGWSGGKDSAAMLTTLLNRIGMRVLDAAVNLHLTPALFDETGAAVNVAEHFAADADAVRALDAAFTQ